jgi:hypothetical protein
VASLFSQLIKRDMENNRNNQGGQQDQQSGQRELDKNETLQNADTVTDYGRSEQQQNVNDLEEKHGMNSGRQGNSSIPMDNDETIGNP